jgi:Outer membrane protein beta-barrel domain
MFTLRILLIPRSFWKPLLDGTSFNLDGYLGGIAAMQRLTQWTRLVLVLLGLGTAVFCSAQATKEGERHIDSRVDIYGGYGYFHPFNSGIDGYQFQSVYNPNATVSVSAYFNRYFGVQIEGGYFSGSNEHKQYLPTCTGETCSQLVYTAQGGPVFRLPLGRWVPFAHMLGGGERTNGPAGQSLMWGWGATGGVGLDYVLPFWGQHLAIRPIQADYQYSQVVYGPLLLPSGTEGGFSALNNMKLSAGLVLRLGDVEPPYPVMLGCSAQPSSVYPGDPIKIEANALHLNPKKTPVYTWASNGGKITASGPEATIDTTGLAPGDYTVTGHVQEGPKARQQASCAAPFTVKAFEPPTLTCSANPSTAVSGTDIAINTVGTSPQNRPLTYSYTATAGVIASSGPTAILSTAGLSPSTITVTCNVVDDLGQAAKATTDVIITAPVIPVVPQTQQLCSLGFTRDIRRPVRVDNEAKGCLDDIALTLTQQTDARLIMVGNAAPEEKPEAAAERALNARQYLVQEKGIDPSRIDLRIGASTGKTVTDTLVPTGAVFNNPDTHTFDEKTIVRHGQAYGIPHSTKAPSKSHGKSTGAAPPVPTTAPATTTPTPAPVAVPATPAPTTTEPQQTTTPAATTPSEATPPAATPTPATTTEPATTTVPTTAPQQTTPPASTPAAEPAPTTTTPPATTPTTPAAQSTPSTSPSV